ncbi:MAG: aminotransferase class V-fold PLP-dependent enzyme [Sphaerochaetaceae bacterium]
MSHLIYVDNAATSWPKAPTVPQAMSDALTGEVGNVGRSSHTASIAASEIVYQGRVTNQKLLPYVHRNKIIFTSGATESLNIAIQGSVEAGHTILVSSVEHNAVARVIHHLSFKGVTYKKLVCDASGVVDLTDLKKKLEKERISLVVITHANNVNGAINPIQEIASMCASYGAPLVVDASQTAGEIELPTVEYGAICFSHHKGLLGPPGVGVMALVGDFAPRPLLFGGTGSNSESVVQPSLTPDAYESGTLPIASIHGASSGIEYVLEHWDELQRTRKEAHLLLYDLLVEKQSVRILTPKEKSVSVLSLAGEKTVLDEIALLLYQHNIAVRGGFHCAPWAHQHFGTDHSGGTIRFSVGPTTQKSDIERIITVLEDIR